MNTGTMAMIFGVVFVPVGLTGFFPSPPPADAPPLAVEHGHGLALGAFPINTLHNVVHLLFGVLGLRLRVAQYCRPGVTSSWSRLRMAC